MDLKRNVRSVARHMALDGLSGLAVASPRRDEHLRRPRVQFLYFHALAPGDTENFRRFLEKLSEKHYFIGHSEAVNKIVEGRIDRPYVSFSLDDGLKSNIAVARVLEEFGTRGMFFVPPAIIGNDRVEEVREFFDYAPEVREAAMDWSDLEWLKVRGHEIGNHTLNHPTLENVDTSQAIDEVVKGADLIRSRLGVCEHFAWPRGDFRFFPQSLKEVVFDSGHQSCASGVRGAHVASEVNREDLCLRRDLVASYWPVRHSMYFVQRSATAASSLDNSWPEQGGPSVSR